MAATVVSRANSSILEILNLYNYEDWSLRIETHFFAEDLWDVVEATAKTPNNDETEYRDWRMKNAKALREIQNSCRTDVFGFIRDIKMAKDAWETLAKRLKPKNRDIEGMPATLVPSVMISLKPLNQDNYEHWSFWVKTYLLAENLWEVVEGTREAPKQEDLAWRKNNARALHVITLFCGDDAESCVRDSEMAKDAWNSLAKKFNPPEVLEATVNSEVDPIHPNDDDTSSNDGIADLGMAIHFSDIEKVKCIVEKKKLLLQVMVYPFAKTIPVLYAFSYDKPKIARYLYSVTPIGKLKIRDAAELVSMGLRLKHLDIPLDLLRHYPNLIIAKDHSGEYPLNELAGTRAGLFPNVSQLGIWKRLIYRCIHIPRLPDLHVGDVSITVPKEDNDQGNRKQSIRKVICFFRRPVVKYLRHLSGIDSLYQMKLLHVRTIEILDHMCQAFEPENFNYMQRKFAEKAAFQAVERGHVLFIERLILPNRSWCLAITNEHDKTLFQFAAEHRQDQIFDLIRYDWLFTAKQREEILSRKDKFGNNMLHVVGKLSPLTQIAHIRGAALQMQYELQWFKGTLLDQMQKVESMASPKDHNCINSDGLTPREVFTINHRDLVKEGELSMKETATSSSALVAALIITIMFAVVVTVPGGINEGTGIPIYLNTDAFMIFIIADVISLCSSTTSVMVFLGIHTSRFAEEDFLTSLPTKLIIGFLSLFLSIGSMMVAFASAIFIMLPGKPSIVIPSIVLAGVPIVSYLWMQLPFLLEIIISTSGLSFRPMYRRLKRWARRLMWWAQRIYWRLKQWAWRLKWWAPVNQGSNPCSH